MLGVVGMLLAQLAKPDHVDGDPLATSCQMLLRYRDEARQLQLFHFFDHILESLERFKDAAIDADRLTGLRNKCGHFAYLHFFMPVSADAHTNASSDQVSRYS
jgi:hypothetical protein